MALNFPRVMQRLLINCLAFSLMFPLQRSYGSQPDIIFEDSVRILTDFATNVNGWSSFNTFPRTVADFNGDGKADIIGFGQRTNVGLSKKNSFLPVSQVTDYLGIVNGWSSFDTFPRVTADVNGDGKEDLIGFGNENDEVYVCLSSGAGVSSCSNFLSNNYGSNWGWTNFSLYPRMLADVNGDGKADVIGFKDAGAYVSLSTGTGFQNAQLLLSEYGTNQGWTNFGTYPRAAADINGDGKADIVGFKADGVYVSFSTGTGFSAPSLLLSEYGTQQGWTSFDLYPRMLADVDGDGKADIIGFKSDGVYVSFSTGTGFLSPSLLLRDYGTNQGWSSFDLYPRAVGDVNGDGKADIIGFKDDGTYVSFASIGMCPPGNQCFDTSTYYPVGKTCITTGTDYCATSSNQCVDLSTYSSPGNLLCTPSSIYSNTVVCGGKQYIEVGKTPEVIDGSGSSGDGSSPNCIVNFSNTTINGDVNINFDGCDTVVYYGSDSNRDTFLINKGSDYQINNFKQDDRVDVSVFDCVNIALDGACAFTGSLAVCTADFVNRATGNGVQSTVKVMANLVGFDMWSEDNFIGDAAGTICSGSLLQISAIVSMVTFLLLL